MTEQNYKELTEALKHSEIPLQMQKELQRLIDKEYINNSCNSECGMDDEPCIQDEDEEQIPFSEKDDYEELEEE